MKKFIKTVSNLKIFSFMCLISKNLYNISGHLKNSFFAKNINSHIITILSLFYLGALLFAFMLIFEYRLIDVFQIFLLSIISFSVFIFISDKYKFSNNKFIFFLQKFIFYILILALIVLFGWLLYLVGVNVYISSTIFCDSEDSDEEAVDSTKNNNKSPKEKDVLRVTEDKEKDTYTLEFPKKIVDSALEKGPEIIVEGIKDVGPKIGIAAAAGKAAVETIKQTSGMAPIPRLITVGAAAFVTAAGTKLGMDLGISATENTTKGDEIEASKSKLAAISKEGPDSPTEFNRGFINSVLEENEIPLITMVNGLSLLNYIELSLVISIFSLLFRKFLIRKLTDIIIKLFQKLKKQKFKEVEKNKDIDKNLTLNQAINTLDKYTDFIIVFIFLCLFWILFINIFFSVNLAENIDTYVTVYNHIKKQ